MYCGSHLTIKTKFDFELCLSTNYPLATNITNCVHYLLDLLPTFDIEVKAIYQFCFLLCIFCRLDIECSKMLQKITMKPSY